MACFPQRNTTGALRKRRSQTQASVFTALVDEVPDPQAAKRDALAQLADISDGLGGGLFPLHSGRFLLGQGFEGAGDDFLGRVVAAGAEVGRDGLLAVGVESERQGHGSM